VLASTSGEEFLSCLTEKLMIYALGRGPTDSDHCWIRQLVASSDPEKTSIQDVIVAIVESDAFQKTVTGGRSAESTD